MIALPQVLLFLMVPIPLLGSEPRVACLLCLQPQAGRVRAMLAVFAIGAAVLWGVGLIALNFFILLASPLYQLVLLTHLRRRFVRVHRREPIDVAFNWTPGLRHDRLFALFNALFGLFLPFLLLLWATPVHPAV